MYQKEEISLEYKICSKCKKKKLISEFYCQLRNKDRLHGWCKECVCKGHKTLYENSPERRKQVGKQVREWEKKHIYRRWAYQSAYSHRRNGYIIQITIDELEQLAKETIDCFYCGVNLQYNSKVGNYSGATLDRVDNDKIIIKDTIRIICRRCNFSKSNRTHDEFIEYCKIVVRRIRLNNVPKRRG